MSLLLDALKKAAREKQNADSFDRETGADAGLSLEPVGELPLSFDDPAEDAAVIERPDSDDGLALEPISDAGEPARRPATRLSSDFYESPITPTPSTVSDEALQLLINKTNKDYRRTRFLTWGGVGVAAVVLLVMSGLYFYSTMMDDIESMHRKHQIALATLESQTRIEENLTSLAQVPETGRLAGGAATVSGSAVEAADTVKSSSTAPRSSPDSRQTITIERADKRDPVSAALERGWQAYQRQDYDTSLREYRKVLAEETDNHDAMLGVAAISLQQNDPDTARELYIKLLERDPRDPRAHAGLANIAQTSGASLSESKLKQLIEFRPDDSHLHFALGNLYVQKRNWPQAQQAFFNAWKADTKNPDYVYNLAVSLDQLGKHAQAKAFYEDSLQLASGKNISFSPEAVRNRLAYLETVD